MIVKIKKIKECLIGGVFVALPLVAATSPTWTAPPPVTVPFTSGQAAVNFTTTVCQVLLTSTYHCSDDAGLKYFVPALLDGVTTAQVLQSIAYWAYPVDAPANSAPGVPLALLPNGNYNPNLPVQTLLNSPNIVNTVLGYKIDSLYRSVLGWQQADQGAINYWVRALANGTVPLGTLKSLLCTQGYGPRSGCAQLIRPSLMPEGITQPLTNLPASADPSFACPAGTLDTVDWLTMDAPRRGRYFLGFSQVAPLWSLITDQRTFPGSPYNLIWNVYSATYYDGVGISPVFYGGPWDIYRFDDAFVYAWITSVNLNEYVYGDTRVGAYSIPLSTDQWPIAPRCAPPGLPGSTSYNAESRYIVAVGHAAPGKGPITPYIDGFPRSPEPLSSGVLDCAPDPSYLSKHGDGTYLDLGPGFYQTWGPFQADLNDLRASHPEAAFASVPTVAIVHAYQCGTGFTDCLVYEEAYYARAYGLVRWRYFQALTDATGKIVLDANGAGVYQLRGASTDQAYTTLFPPLEHGPMQPVFRCKWPK